jgi:hypothetical protein
MAPTLRTMPSREMKKEFRTKNLLSVVALNPEFIEVSGCVFFAGTSPALLPSRTPESPEERQALESLVNRREVLELFEVAPPEPSNDLLYTAGTVIREAWEARLRLQFPHRYFIVGFEYALPVCQLTFFQALSWHLEAAQQVVGRENNRWHADWRYRLRERLRETDEDLK